MTEHKHAAVLRALADGEPMEKFEVTWGTKRFWVQLDNYQHALLQPETYDIRRKQEFITVNGYKVPKPRACWDKSGKYVYVPRPDNPTWYDAYAGGCPPHLLQRGIAHETKEAAIAHARAMTGINPNWPFV